MILVCKKNQANKCFFMVLIRVFSFWKVQDMVFFYLNGYLKKIQDILWKNPVWLSWIWCHCHTADLLYSKSSR